MPGSRPNGSGSSGKYRKIPRPAPSRPRASWTHASTNSSPDGLIRPQSSKPALCTSSPCTTRQGQLPDPVSRSSPLAVAGPSSNSLNPGSTWCCEEVLIGTGCARPQGPRSTRRDRWESSRPIRRFRGEPGANSRIRSTSSATTPNAAACSLSNNGTTMPTRADSRWSAACRWRPTSRGGKHFPARR